jgi:hypothetical protein
VCAAGGHVDAGQEYVPSLRTEQRGGIPALFMRHDDTSSPLTDMVCCIDRARQARLDTSGTDDAKPAIWNAPHVHRVNGN